VQNALGDDPKRADRCQSTALAAIDLVYTVALPNRPALASTGEVEVPREYIARLAIPIPIAIARAAASTNVTAPSAATIAIVVARIMPVPHASLLTLGQEVVSLRV
jgi:hypothetical protein